MIGFSSLNALATETEQAEKRSDMAFRHVLFEQYQGNHREAYIAADYYRERQVANESMTLVQAAASLELGYLDHGRALIAGLEETPLLPENQSRLRLYLARDAYRRRDWPLLAGHLERLEDLPLSSDIQRNHATYLSLELARHRGDLDGARSYVDALDSNFSLRLNGLFNLAVAHAATPDGRDVAVATLNEVVSSKALDFPSLMIKDRARVALAELYLAMGEVDFARNSLAKVSVEHRYGPEALAQLARLDMQQERFENAAAIWQYLVTEYTWHRAATHATSGLGYALQNARGDEAAFAVYNQGFSRMKAHQQRLTNVAERIRLELREPGMFSTQDESLIVWLTDALGHEDWFEWFASSDVRNVASRWQALDEAYRTLLDDKNNLNALLAVDAEQQARVVSINEKVRDVQSEQQLTEIRKTLQSNKQRLVAAEPKFSDNLREFASTAQINLLDEIGYYEQAFAPLKQNLPSHDLTSNLDQRIARLKGLVRFEVFLGLPVEKQKQVNAIDAQLKVAEQAANRLERITRAAQRPPEGVSARIEILATKRRALEQETLLALQASRNHLLVSLDELIVEDRLRLEQQMAGLHYDITRLADRRLAERAP